LTPGRFRHSPSNQDLQSRLWSSVALRLAPLVIASDLLAPRF
jgi:hypothetical protein